ncbi:MAG TPA: hypothetical protein VH208_05650, partial [Myxococcaceae bacterium]|nr:hypothetical protein [Myxococcaceae bacterium]
LRERVRKAVTTLPDGSRALMPEKDIVRPDGLPPSSAEATALAVLALEGDKQAPWRADLGSYLLGQYRPESGWGDGQTNLACLRAVLALFKDPLPPRVRVSLEMDGKAVTDGTLQGERLKDTLALETGVEGAAGKHTWTVKADPPLPGLGYALTLRTWVPWEREEAQGGFELSLKVGSPLKVGQAAPVDVAAAAPGGVVARIRQALPAGVQVDRPSLEKLRSDGAIIGFEVGDGEVTLDLKPREANEPFTARYRVIPTLAGTLHAAASTISPVNQPELAYELPPVVWKVE